MQTAAILLPLATLNSNGLRVRVIGEYEGRDGETMLSVCKDGGDPRMCFGVRKDCVTYVG